MPRWLLYVACWSSAAATLRKVPLHGVENGAENEVLGLMVAEEWAAAPVVSLEQKSKIMLMGSSRAFLGSSSMSSYPAARWERIKYRKLHLLGHALKFSVDLSRVGCGCNAAVYLVAMNEPTYDTSAYCDIQGADAEPPYPVCFEADLLEGNSKAVQATVHSRLGRGGVGGACDQDGCHGNLGKLPSTAARYGAGSSRIDSRKPFEVTAAFPELPTAGGGSGGSGAPGATLDVMLSQGDAGGAGGHGAAMGVSGRGSVLSFGGAGADRAATRAEMLLDGRSAVAGDEDLRRTHAALSRGLVLVVSLCVRRRACVHACMRACVHACMPMPMPTPMCPHGVCVRRHATDAGGTRPISRGSTVAARRAMRAAASTTRRSP